MLMFGTPFWFIWGVLPAYFYEFFLVQVRYTGISVGSQSATIIGGFVPFFATANTDYRDSQGRRHRSIRKMKAACKSRPLHFFLSLSFELVYAPFSRLNKLQRLVCNSQLST